MQDMPLMQDISLMKDVSLMQDMPASVTDAKIWHSVARSDDLCLRFLLYVCCKNICE